MAKGDILRSFRAPIPTGTWVRGAAFDGKDLYITIGDIKEIYKIDTNGNYISKFLTVNYYSGLCYDKDENVLWAGNFESNGKFYKIDLTGLVLLTVDFASQIPPQFLDGHDCESITIDPTTNTLVMVTGYGSHYMHRFTKAGGYLESIHINTPIGVNGISSDGYNYWVTIDKTPGELKKINKYGEPIDTITIPSLAYSYLRELDYDDITFSPNTVVWVTDFSDQIDYLFAIEVGIKTTREQAITDIIESVALQQTAISHILNAEGEKIQKAEELKLTPKQLLKVNESANKVVNSITMLEMVLQMKLGLFDCDLCPPKNDLKP